MDTKTAFEIAGRADKVARAAAMLDGVAGRLCRTEDGLKDMIVALRKYTPDEWAVWFKEAEVNAPSPTTIEQLIGVYEQRLGRLVSGGVL